jgi:hypothetical protein
VLGLASHHLPLVRRFMPQLEDVVEARPIEPWGYAITLVGGGTLAQMVGTVSISPTPHWTFRATSPTQDLHVAFPPPYVQAGSATAALAGDPARTWHHRTNGYVAEWKLLARLAREGDDGSRVREAVADFEWGTRIVEAARCSS